jgi:hypothetical protein
MEDRMKKRVFGMTALLMLLLTAPVPTALADDDDDESQTVLMVSGNGPLPGRDPFTEFSTDGGLSWDQSYIVDKNPAYADPIAGSQWISIDANLGLPVAPGQEIRYRRAFDLPNGCKAGNAGLSVILHVDNEASATTGGGVFLNGELVGSTLPGPLASIFQDPPEGPYTTVGPFRRRANLLEFRTRDQGVVTALDYEVTLTCKGDDDEDPDGD